MKWDKVVFGLLLMSLVTNAWLALGKRDLADSKAGEVEVLRAKFPYLSPRVLVEGQNDVLVNFLQLRRKLKMLVEPWGEEFAFYFEYLPTGTSIGVNEKQEFKAASLFKVPVVMAYYRQQEQIGIENNSLVTIREEDVDANFGDLWQKGVGAKITLDEAARLSLTESDNTAHKVLAANIERQYFDDVYEGLDIDLRLDGDEFILTAKHYTSILKALYFGAVLSKESSQKVLELLTQTVFDDKLVAGVPKGVSVAHKFGVLAGKEYHDCGIVYVPKRPYSLCMVSRSNEETARGRMTSPAIAKGARASSRVRFERAVRSAWPARTRPKGMTEGW